MNQEQINRYTASLYRQTFLLKMLDAENTYFAQFKAPSGLKNEFVRLSKVYSKGIENIKLYMPNSKDSFDKHIKQSEEKISASLNILEKLMILDDETVFKLEDDFNKLVKIQYA